MIKPQHETPVTEADAQRLYWNALAPEYREVTRIHANDFHYGPRLPGESALRLLPMLRPGQRALELGCGAAQNSIFLARAGLACTAVDISEAQLAFAREDAAQAGVTLRLIASPLEAFEPAPGERFDLIHSSHAFEFIEEPGALIGRIRNWLAPGGTLVLSTVHPVYNGEWIYAEDPDDESAGSWGRFLPSYFEPEDDIREQPGGGGPLIRSRAWPISQWFAWLKAAGFTLTHLAEPPACTNPAYSSDAWEDDDGEALAIPTTLILTATLPTGETL